MQGVALGLSLGWIDLWCTEDVIIGWFWCSELLFGCGEKN